MEKFNENILSPLVIKYITCENGGNDYYVPEHKIMNYQWFYIISGGIEQTVNGKKYLLQANDSLLIPPKEIRSPKLYKSPPSYICAVFSLKNIELSALYLKVINTPANILPVISALEEELAYPISNNSPVYQHSLLMYIMMGLLRHKDMEELQEQENRKIHHQAVLAKKIVSYMQTNLQKPISRKDFASIVNLSVSQTARIFKSETGKSLNDALTDLRIKRAQFLLSNSTLPITQISFEVGINSFSHFTQKFKQIVGLSPSGYRSKMQ